MTGGTLRFRQDQKRIAIAIDLDILNPQHMSGGFAFLPEPLFAAAEESHEPAAHRCLKRFAVHITEHQDAEALRILYDHGHKTVAPDIRA